MFYLILFYLKMLNLIPIVVFLSNDLSWKVNMIRKWCLGGNNNLSAHQANGLPIDRRAPAPCYKFYKYKWKCKYKYKVKIQICLYISDSQIFWASDKEMQKKTFSAENTLVCQSSTPLTLLWQIALLCILYLYVVN